MKWAEAKTRLSFVTATLNCLWVATPPSFQQHHVDARAGQVSRSPGIQRVGLVPELAVERRGAPGAGSPVRRAAAAPAVGSYDPSLWLGRNGNRTTLILMRLRLEN